MTAQTSTNLDLALLHSLGVIHKEIANARRKAIKALEESGYYQDVNAGSSQLDLVETLDRIDDLSRYISRKITKTANA